MAELQRRKHAEGMGGSPGVSSRTYMVVVESVEGSVVQVEVNGTDTIGQVRQTALEQIGAITDNPEKYIVMTANENGRVLNAATTIDELLSKGEVLRLQLIPQTAFGPKPVEYDDA